MAGGLTMSYDEENRMAQAVSTLNGTEQNIYNPSGQLVYRLGGSVGGNPPAEVYIYGPQGQRLQFGLTLPSWSDDNQMVLAYEEQELYFAGKLLEADDRVGTSAVIPPTYYDGYLVGLTTGGTFPYGELRQAPATGDRYATYLLDSTTNLNYAMHRWYSSQVARFTTVDPSNYANPQIPQNWNRYA
jgi:RHS repeat-associated protein